MMVKGQSPDFALSDSSDTQHSSEDVGVLFWSFYFQDILPGLGSLFQQQQDILESGESIARSFGKILLVDKFSHRLESLMGRPGPNLVESQFTVEHLDWLLIIQEYSSGGNIERQPDGTVHCYVPGLNVTARLSEAEHQIMATRAPEKLLDPWSYAQDICTEQEAVSCLRRRMEELHQQLTEGKKIYYHNQRCTNIISYPKKR